MDTTWLLDTRNNRDDKTLSTRRGDAAATARVLVCSITNDWRVCTYDHGAQRLALCTAGNSNQCISKRVRAFYVTKRLLTHVLFLLLLLNQNQVYRLARTLTTKMWHTFFGYLCSSHGVYMSLRVVLAIYTLAISTMCL